MTEREPDKHFNSVEIRDIIERMPSNFARIVTLLILIVLLVFFSFGWYIRYPDIILGQVVISSNQAPIKLFTSSPGSLNMLNTKAQQSVAKNQVIAIINNPTNYNDVEAIRRVIDEINPSQLIATELYRSLPKSVQLGEISNSYFSFLNAVKLLADYQYNRIYDRQELALRDVVNEQHKVINASVSKRQISSENLDISAKFLVRDSLLFRSGAISRSEFEMSKVKHISSKDQFQQTLYSESMSREQLVQTISKIEELGIAKIEKERQLLLDVLASYTDLSGRIDSWKQKYLIISPIDGKVQFLKFWHNTQYVLSGEPIFTIWPKREKPWGQLLLPISGAGKVKIGQKVVIKLDDYPYSEYGTVHGNILSISNATNTIKTENGEMEVFLVSVRLKEELITNYGRKIDFKYETRGTAEIVVEERRLLERLFDKIRSVSNR